MRQDLGEDRAPNGERASTLDSALHRQLPADSLAGRANIGGSSDGWIGLGVRAARRVHRP